MNALLDFRSDDLALIRRTVARDCNDDEFRMFIHLCKATGLDPLRRQCYAFVFGKNDKDKSKRQLTLVTAVTGYRTIADRTGNYRPDENEPEHHYLPWKVDRDRELAEARRVATLKERRALQQEIEETYPIDPLNPLGVERTLVRCWKHAHGGWHPVTGEVYWEEFVPIKDEWQQPEGGGRARPTGRKWIDPKKTGWVKMPRLMIAKCAEAMALRKAWPDHYANVHVEEETHGEQSRLDVVEAIEKFEETARIERAKGAGRTILIDLGGNLIEPVAVGKFADRCLAFIAEQRGNPGVLDAWQTRNRYALREFHAVEKSAALAIKSQLEAAITAAQERAEAD
jgi:phage recombination protein Bet